MRALKTVFAPEAAAELEQIADFIAQDSPGRAQKFVTGLIKAAKNIGRFPARGVSIFTREEIGFVARKIVHKGYAIIYEATRERIRILHVAAPGRNWTE